MNDGYSYVLAGMETVLFLIDFVLHINVHLGELFRDYGPWVYAILFLIVFCETGLVVTPFLPGDSLLFAAGALAATIDGGLSLSLLMILLWVAAVLGDAANYAIGKHMGPAVFHSDKGKLLNKAHLAKAHAFYEKYGGKTIIIARFVPIVRTFAPFVAGIGSMTYPRFALFNVVGAALWVGLCVGGGYLFGNIPWVQSNFSAVILGIIVVSVIPVVVETWKARKG